MWCKQQENPHDSDKDKLREGQKNDASRAGSSQPIPEKSSEAKKPTPESKSGTPPSRHVPRKAVKEPRKRSTKKATLGRKVTPPNLRPKNFEMNFNQVAL